MTAEDWFWTIVLLALTVLISWAFNRPSHDEADTEYDWDDSPFIRDVRMWKDDTSQQQHKEKK